MPGCCVEGCRNRTEYGIRMFLLPQGNKNLSRRAQWISNIGRIGLPLNSVVCEVHFTADQFENKRQDQRRLLKWNAVPTIFDNITDTSSNRKRRRMKSSKTDKDEKNTFDFEKVFLLKDNTVNLIESSDSINQTGCHGGTENTNVKGKESCDNEDNLLKSDKNNDAIRRSTRKVKSILLEDYYLEGDLNNFCSSSSDTIEKNKSSCNLKYVDNVNSEESAPPRFSAPISGQKKSPVSKKKIMYASVNNICRICGKLSKTLLPIFGIESRKKCVPSLINQYLPIKVRENDVGRPVNICSVCVHYLIKWDELFKNSKKVDDMFSRLNKPVVPESLQCRLSPSIERDISEDQDIGDSAGDNGHAVTKDDKFTSGSNDKENCYREIISASAFNDHNYCPLDKELQQKRYLHDVNCISSTDKVAAVLPKSYTKESGEGLSDSDIDGSVNDMGNKVNLTAHSRLKEYKIGITLVKSKECLQEAELDFNKLKSILMDKVDNLFQSICDDETIMKSLVKPSSGENDNDMQVNDDNNCCKRCEVTVNIGNTISGTSCKDMKNNKDSYVYCNGLRDMSVNKNCYDKDVCDNRKRFDCKTSVHKKYTYGLQSKLMKRRKLSKMLSSQSQTSSQGDEPYLCNSCGRFFQTRRSFVQHHRLHHTEKKCDYCDLTLVSFLDYRRHVSESHKDKICNICCEVCGEKFVKRERLQRHMLILHNIGDYFYCDKCCKKCSSKQQLYCHKNLKHKSQENLCHFCGNKFPSYSSLGKHIKSKHASEKIHECTICGKKLSSRNTLVTHLTRHASEDGKEISEVDRFTTMDVLNALLDKKSYSCLVCGVKVGDVEMLKQHMSYHSSDELVKELSGLNSGKLNCYLCNKYFEKEKDLALHRFYLHQEVPFLCQIKDCELTFWHKSTLIVHQMSVHKSQSSVMCSICNEVFKNNKQKRIHDETNHSMTISNKNELLGCNHCSKSFHSIVSLRNHEKIHEISSQCICHICGKLFKLKSKLSKHLDCHSLNLVENNEELFAAENINEHVIMETYENIPLETRQTSLSSLSKYDSEFLIQAIDEKSLSGEIKNIDLPVVDGEIFKTFTMFKCPDCSVLFTDKEVLDNHLASVHNGKVSLDLLVTDFNLRKEK